MGCIEKIYSVSALVGTGKCNANCAFCAGEYLRPEARFQNKALYDRNLEVAIKLSARYGGWALSFTSAGEPTCEPEAITSALQVYKKCADQGAYFPNVNLFTNGILFGDENYCDTYLPIWKELGLTNVAVSIHEKFAHDQAETYGVKNYPLYNQLVNNIEKHGVGVRATMLLRNGGIDTPQKYYEAISYLIHCGITNITSWPVGNPDATRNEFTPSRWNLFRIRCWLHMNAKVCHGHVWGGGVFDYKGNILRYTDYVTKHNPRKDFVRQLVVFQDATVAYSWIREGALCMK